MINKDMLTKILEEATNKYKDVKTNFPDNVISFPEDAIVSDDDIESLDMIAGYGKVLPFRRSNYDYYNGRYDD